MGAERGNERERERVKRLQYTVKALQDFQEIHDYIAKDNIDAAADFIKRLQHHCGELCEMPGMGRKRDDLAAGVRSSTVGDYLIFYRVLNGILEIAHILHGRRNLKRIFEQE